MAQPVLPPLHRPPPEAALSLFGMQTPDGWEYACVACNATCVVRHRWSRFGNKHNGWGVYRWLSGGNGAGTWCPTHAVEETRRRARGR